MRALFSVVVVLGLAAGVAGVSAQDANVRFKDELTLLQRQDITATGHEAITAVDVLEPGARAAWHTHPGEMIAFVSEGRVTVERVTVERQSAGRSETATFAAGESFIVPAGVPHSSVNHGRATARMFVTFVVDKSKSLTVPAAVPGR